MDRVQAKAAAAKIMEFAVRRGKEFREVHTKNNDPISPETHEKTKKHFYEMIVEEFIKAKDNKGLDEL